MTTTMTTDSVMASSHSNVKICFAFHWGRGFRTTGLAMPFAQNIPALDITLTPDCRQDKGHEGLRLSTVCGNSSFCVRELSGDPPNPICSLFEAHGINTQLMDLLSGLCHRSVMWTSTETPPWPVASPGEKGGAQSNIV